MEETVLIFQYSSRQMCLKEAASGADNLTGSRDDGLFCSFLPFSRCLFLNLAEIFFSEIYLVKSVFKKSQMYIVIRQPQNVLNDKINMKQYFYFIDTKTDKQLDIFISYISNQIWENSNAAWC